MAVRGIFASHNSIVGDRVGDFASNVLQYMPGGMTPLLAISAGMEKESVADTGWSWLEDSWLDGNLTIATSGGGNSSATSLTVVDSGICVPNTILLNQNTGEHLYVTAVAGNVLTVTRGFAGTTAATVSNADKLQSIGTAYPEGSGKPTAVTQRGESRSNLVQIFKNAWAITGTAKAVKYHTGSQVAKNKSDCAAFHAEDLERAMIWGRKSLTIQSGLQMRTTNGVLAQIEGYGGLVESATDGSTAGNYSLRLLRDFMRRIYDKQVKGRPNERIAFCGSKVLALIQEMVLQDATYNIAVGETQSGIKVTKIIGFNGDFTLMTHPMMVSNPVWNEELYVFHPGLIKKKVLRDSWEESFGIGNNNGIDAEEGFLAIEMGIEVKGAQTMGVLKDISTAIPSYS